MKITQLLEPTRERYGLTNMPFMQRMLKHAEANQPYRGLNILHNIPLCMNTLLKIEPLVVGGGDVTVTSPSFFRHDPQAKQLLEDAGVSVELDHQAIEDDVDYVLDSNADFCGLVTPRRGAVELTRSGVHRYSDPSLTYPVIDVDTTELKGIETCYGTGDGCVRGLQHFIGDEFHGKPFVIFGYGKVGYGSALGLKKYTDHITVVEVNEALQDQARTDGFDVLHGGDIDAVHRAVEQAYGIVTATGVENLISTQYNPALFRGKKLANIGVLDEYGSAFASDEIFNKKQGINFGLPDPTLMHFMDPIFYAHNLAIDLIETGDYLPGIHVLPQALDRSIVDEWKNLFLTGK